ncbi:MAG: phosphoenolpyruvate carboxykinase (ATP), partial [Acidobacteriota bacterium]|nr:phosphoenolpyruvate carboxykinase (ATP) [Acidobacteriota bacterium]
MSSVIRDRLHGVGLGAARNVTWNLSVPALYEATVVEGLGKIASMGPMVVNTAPYTGRSPKDKFVVRDPSIEEKIAWGAVNQEISPDRFEALRERVTGYLRNRDLYVEDLRAGADPAHSLPIRLVTESPWHALFARNMFIEIEDPQERDRQQPEFTILHAPHFQADPRRDGTRSEAFVMLSFARKMVLIGGTRYAGEIKKSIFTVLNGLLPLQGVLSMHCSANVGARGDVALFFGLSGTGKTTLSADPERPLIGDDEHGWSDNGIFNFEGGCYAKVIRLDPEHEPEIFRTTRTFGTIIENVVMDEVTRTLDLDSDEITENTRAAYPIDQLPNIVPAGTAGHPENIVFLTADAFGVLPPIAALDPEQAMYYFLSGYTAKVAGTERGVKEPQATFSACFGEPFLPLHPNEYASMLGDKIREHRPRVWLINTGWTA